MSNNNLEINLKTYFPKTASPEGTAVDILLMSMPLTLSDAAWAAGAALKSVAVAAGYSCATVDLNVYTLHWLKRHPSVMELKDFFWEGKILEQHRYAIDLYTDWVIEIIRKYNPKILGLSVFTDFSRHTTILIAKAVKKHLPHVKIIIGGHGVSNGFLYTDNSISFGEKLKQEGVVDHYILGDAEYSFTEFLKNNLDFLGIDQSQWQQLNNNEIENIPYPDYSDYDWALYPNKTIGITGSRGCVRQCKFCDYIATWKNYTWRSADNIFEEMLYQKQKYGISNFQFSDSLINGNLKEYEKLVTKLSDYNFANPSDPFKWASFFIFRPKSQFGEKLWQLTASSGANAVIVGIESFNDVTRFDMGKKFTNKDIDDALEMCIKYKINVVLLFFVGYVTDTQKNIDETLAWLDEHQHLKDHIVLATQRTLMILPGSWLDKNQKIINIELLNPENTQSWVNLKTGSNLEIREAWQEQIISHIDKLGYPLIQDGNLHKWLEDMLEK